MRLVGKLERARKVEERVMERLLAERQEANGHARATVLADWDEREYRDRMALAIRCEVACLQVEHRMTPPPDYYAHLDESVRTARWQCDHLPALRALVDHLLAWQAECKRAEHEGRPTPPCPPVDLPERDPEQECMLLAADLGCDPAELWQDAEQLAARGDLDEVWEEFQRELRGG